jgi:hypothetical protein
MRAGAQTRMRTSASIFIAGGSVAPRSTDLLLAWSDAADDAHAAYLAWRDAKRGDQPDAFVVYRAALDREEAAARALQDVTSAAA